MKVWLITMDENPIVRSHDGSNTLLSKKFGVTYHSKFGAVDESITVFLSAGLQYQLLRKKQQISILEMGFGTGLNAFLTLLESLRHPAIQISYTGVELYPISESQSLHLGYPTYLNVEDLNDVFIDMHKAEFDVWHQIKYLKFRKKNVSILEVKPDQKYDVIYYDAFAPTAQEELWTPELMAKMYACTNEEGVLVTYCAKGSFKRALRAAGYTLESLPGPSGKREMTRAIKKC